MEVFLLVLLFGLAHTGKDGEQFDRRQDFAKKEDNDEQRGEDSFPWNNLEQLAELERSAEYSIKVIVLTMNRWEERIWDILNMGWAIKLDDDQARVFGEALEILVCHCLGVPHRLDPIGDSRGQRSRRRWGLFIRAECFRRSLCKARRWIVANFTVYTVINSSSWPSQVGFTVTASVWQKPTNCRLAVAMSPSGLPREILDSGDRDSDGQYHGDGDGNDDDFPVTGGRSIKLGNILI